MPPADRSRSSTSILGRRGAARPSHALAGAEEDSPSTWKERLEAQERTALRETLAQAGGNLTKAAELFGVPRTTYREKLVKNGLLQPKDGSEGL